MKNPITSTHRRKPYARPRLTVIKEDELLAILGPAQGYGTEEAMPVDSEWVRRG